MTNPDENDSNLLSEASGPKGSVDDVCISNQKGKTEEDDCVCNESSEVTLALQGQTTATVDEKSPETNTISEAVSPDDQDGGYGWVIMMCSLLVFTMYGANWVLFSVYIVDFSEAFDKPQAFISVIGSIDTAMSQFMALPAGAFISLYGCRPVCLTGLLIYSIGTLASAFTTDFSSLLITFGFIKGLGAGMIYIPCSVIVQQYFKRRRALAVAFSSSGLSLGTMVFSPIHRLLIHNYGWRGGLILFSGVVLQCTVFAALMKPPRNSVKSRSRSKKQRSSEEEDMSTVENAGCFRTFIKSIWMILCHLHKALNITHLKDIKLLLFLSIKTFGVTGAVTMYKFCIARAVFAGVDKFLASFLITATGFCSCMFRFVGGIIGNSKCVNRLAMYSTTSVMAGLVALLSVVAGDQFYNHLVFYLLYGSFLGMSECLMPVIATDLFGIARLPSTLGWIMAFTGIVVFIYMPVFGYMFDVTQSYTPSFLLGGSVQAIAGGMGYVIMFIKRREDDKLRAKSELEKQEMEVI